MSNIHQKSAEANPYNPCNSDAMTDGSEYQKYCIRADPGGNIAGIMDKECVYSISGGKIKLDYFLAFKDYE
ncbi:MAG TPA: hypothetical protein DD738_13000 [Ruminiclostridium sp.]|nr:hypothetical protein [Ruminiclostridium sp.]